MGKWITPLIIGMVSVAVGGQGAICLLINHSDRGLVSWLPGGFGAALTVDLLLAVVGAALAWLGDARRQKSA